MKAIICTKYGAPEVLKFAEINKPIPKDNEVLIRIRATTAHIGDTKIRSISPGLGPVKDFFFKPVMRFMIGFKGPRRKVLGMDLAGEVVGIGKNVSKFEIGNQIFASTFKGFKFGAYAEYICLHEDGLIAKKPENMTYEEAAPITNGALTSLLVLRKANIRKGQKVLIYGASGSLGSYAVQLAKNYGAKVTGVCSTKNLEMVTSLGADKVIDYTKDNVQDSGDIYDVIFDTVNKIPKSEYKKILSESGIYLDGLKSTEGHKLEQKDFVVLKELCEEGKLKTFIDRQFKLENMVEAHRYVDKGHKRGNVVITV